ncbi:MAG: succinate dehydrogenase/fumarate reductase cytochrome b subunit [Bacteroidales bacterium]|nr:succinate dehydrogenase/fumarate reductase cytochrome b subunit [Bacteroidales bacterium]
MSSIVKKFVMAVSGAAMVFFLLFHALMNLVSIFSESGYEAICEFLGANWYAVVGTIGIAALMSIHLVFAFILSWQNYKSRGSDRYAVVAKNEGVTWASRNMLVIGLIVIIGLALHLYNFWYKMQWSELCGNEPASGIQLIKETFGNTFFSCCYIVWLFFIYLHLSHGISSLMQSIGWNNEVWEKRITAIAKVLSALITLMLVSVVFYYWIIY